jgi:protein-S-isoprenylcysteine O-methyltransferase Ste14
MTTSLARNAWRGLAQFVAALAVLLWLSAWTLRFWQAWVYLLVFTACVSAITAYFLRHDPELVVRRMRAGPAAEHDPVQRRIQAIASVMLCGLYVVAGLDRRWHWSSRSEAVDWRLSLAADAVVAAGFAVIFRTFQENSYASATVEVGAAQRVISTGPYGLVRHPMYAGAIPLFLATPLALGSWWALIPAAGLAAVVVLRLRKEEDFLARDLPGYADYMRRVRFRLVPGIW